MPGPHNIPIPLYFHFSGYKQQLFPKKDEVSFQGPPYYLCSGARIKCSSSWVWVGASGHLALPLGCGEMLILAPAGQSCGFVAT